MKTSASAAAPQPRILSGAPVVDVPAEPGVKRRKIPNAKDRFDTSVAVSREAQTMQVTASGTKTAIEAVGDAVARSARAK
jgi:hypothetical protein